MKIRTPRYADVAATLALVLALGTGGAYAAGKITGKQIAKNTITSSNIKNGTIQKVDLSPTVGTVGPAGAPGQTGPRGFSAWDAIPHGQTVTGRIYNTGVATAASQEFVENVNLPGIAPTALDTTHVNFAPDSYAATTDDDSTCTGSYAAPTAPPGKVCIYADPSNSGSVSNLQSVQGQTWFNPAHRSYAFFVDAFSTAAGQWDFWSSWAYTAP